MTLAFLVEVRADRAAGRHACYCIVLERRLAAVRKGQEGLNAHHRRTQYGHRRCRRLVPRAESAPPAKPRRHWMNASSAPVCISTSLSLLTASGERIAERLEARQRRVARELRPAKPPVTSLQQHHEPPRRPQGRAMTTVQNQKTLSAPSARRRAR